MDWSFPYAGQRMPVMARNIVATSQPLAAQAGIDAMARGGNAIDAALSTAIALAVVEPNMNGIGGDAFALVWEPGEKRLYGLNASGRSPAGWTPERFAGRAAMPELGWDAVTVPGCVSAWATLSARFGRLPFAELFRAAVRYAREGFHVSPISAASWRGAEERLRDYPEFGRVFLPGGDAPRPGQVWASPDHALTLEEIAATGGESFYRGNLAARIAAASAADGGAMTADDLATHACDWVEPVSIGYRGYTLHEIPPNGQGLASLMALGILSHFSFDGIAVDSAEFLHLQIEAMKLALADAHQYIADPAAMEAVRWEDLLKSDYLASRAALLDRQRASEPAFGTPRGGTVLLCAADESGMMVSYIQSNYWGFGSGIVVPETGIAMQNRGWGFSLEPGHPNQVGPRKRPFHTIIPGFVTRGGDPVMAFGVMGGPIQAQGHVQMMVRLADYAQNPQAASDAPRWRVDGGRRVALENTHPPAIIDALHARGHDVTVLPPSGFGGAQLIRCIDGGYCAASDHRKDGAAYGR